MSTLVNKLSLKSIGAQPRRSTVSEENPGPVELAVLFGRVTGYKVGSSQYGEFTKFTGAFEGTNIATGEIFKSSAAFVPAVLEGMLREAVDSADGSALDFAIKIGAKYSATPVGYEYVVIPLVETKESDELAALRATVQAALPAPSASTATEKKVKK